MKRILILMTTILALAACKDWTQMEYIPTDINHPWEQDPSVWEAYTSSLQAYKQSGHTLVYARLANSPESAASEKNFMRCLPDSLDIVSLTNDFSRHDAEDMAMMKQKGTKVLLQLNVLDEDPAEALKLLDKIEELALAEIANAQSAIPFVEQDSRLGWEPSMEYVCDKWHLEWKIRQVKSVIDGDIASYRGILKLQ